MRSSTIRSFFNNLIFESFERQKAFKQSVINVCGRDLMDMDLTTSDHHTKNTMPVCFKKDNLKVIEEYAKKKGMLDYNQAIEHLAKEIRDT